MFRKLYTALLFFSISIIGGCLVVKHPDTGDVTPMVTLSPKPEIKMSEELVRSGQGDMIAFLPEGWFFVDVEDKISRDVFAVAVNKDYTLSVVFSVIRTNDQIDKVVSKEGLLGLARLSLARREKKTAGTIKQVGKYQPLKIGNNEFVKYEFTSTGGALSSQAVVFISSLNQFFEMALIPMDISGKAMMPKTEIDKTFRSIVTTIQF